MVKITSVYGVSYKGEIIEKTESYMTIKTAVNTIDLALEEIKTIENIITDTTITELEKQGYNIPYNVKCLLKYYYGKTFIVDNQKSLVKNELDTNFMIIGNNEKLFLLS